MLVSLHDAMAKQQTLKATGIVIYDDFENPIAVAYELANKMLTISTVGSPDFEDKLQQVGVTKTVAVSSLVDSGNGQMRFLD